MDLTNLFQVAIVIIGSIGSVGILFGGAGYLYRQYKGGAKEQISENKDILSSNDQIKEFYKEQNQDYKTIIKEQDTKIQILIREVGDIKGQLTQVLKQNDEFKAIFQNRDPATKEFMEHVLKSIKDQGEAHKAIMEILKEVHIMSKAEHDRDFKVEATVTKT